MNDLIQTLIVAAVVIAAVVWVICKLVKMGKSEVSDCDGCPIAGNCAKKPNPRNSGAKPCDRS